MEETESKLRQHPAPVARASGQAGGNGGVGRQAVARQAGRRRPAAQPEAGNGGTGGAGGAGGIPPTTAAARLVTPPRPAVARRWQWRALPVPAASAAWRRRSDPGKPGHPTRLTPAVPVGNGGAGGDGSAQRTAVPGAGNNGNNGSAFTPGGPAGQAAAALSAGVAATAATAAMVVAPVAPEGTVPTRTAPITRGAVRAVPVKRRSVARAATAERAARLTSATGTESGIQVPAPEEREVEPPAAPAARAVQRRR